MDEKTVARFWSKVDKSAGPNGCWLWTAARLPNGYGYFGSRGRMLYVCHRCDVRHCVNQAHLFLGTHAENMADMMAKGRSSHAGLHGEMNGCAKLTDTTVASLRADRLAGMSYPKLGAKYGISHVQARKSWKHVG